VSARTRRGLASFHAATIRCGMADAHDKPLPEQLEEIGAQLDWVREYL
jgi:hypothetical protein